MKLPLFILLIPALIAAQDQPPLSPAVRPLLKKTRTGLAEITWQSGTQERAQIVRVTDRFIAIREAGACRNVELASIANIKWKPGPDESDFFAFLAILPIWPYLGAKIAIRSHDPKLGSWESQPQPNKPVVRLRFTYDWDHQGQGQIIEQEVLVRTGHYRFEDGKLYTRYDDAGEETSAAARFECDSLVLDGPQPLRLSARIEQGRAYAPMVGHWVGVHGRNGFNTWDFRSDGAFQEGRPQALSAGSYRKANGGTDIIWMHSTRSPEHWQIQVANGSLFTTRDGKTIEFKRHAPFY